MDENKPIPRYLMFGGIPFQCGECRFENGDLYADPLSVDMTLQGIEKASAEVRCDHGIPILEHCDQCPAEQAG